MTMMSRILRLTAAMTRRIDADPTHAAPAMPSDAIGPPPPAAAPKSGAPSMKSATPSEAPELMPST